MLRLSRKRVGEECSNCVFFKAIKGAPGFCDMDKAPDVFEGEGNWPSVFPTDWCDKWSPKEGSE